MTEKKWPYKSCYCEENIYKSVELLPVEDRPRSFVVFISSENRSVPLYAQRSSSREDKLALWDYHVILLIKQSGFSQWFVLDHDSTVNQPPENETQAGDFRRTMLVPFQSYAQATFKQLPNDLLDRFSHLVVGRKFRVIRGDQYLRYFASDRSHMVTIDKTTNEAVYVSQPPVWTKIQGFKSKQLRVCMNIDDYIDMTKDSANYGQVLHEDEFLARFAI
ncbi:N-terminal glutamine amidase-domain-containing protein [Lipomyces japonicus]|uniref:N-terminal glutamine amidase-domain-containing protein n=1 Tax=Lipomyces japonicus TaxID=56871 RepID=UPI0034CFFBE5